ncbi:MAG: ABC transporter substrate-binding protein [Acetobacteraceae bacterium]|nr:ABC transporter substrate-binding protein [Acetobacteraceae bacterium]
MRHVRLQEPFRALFYAPFYAALARGDYAAEGVTVELVSGTQPALAKDSVLEGRADLAWGGPMRILLAHDADAASPLRNFAAVVMGDPFLLVGSRPNPGFRLRDLAGMTLATVSEVPTPWWTLQEDIRQDGVDPASIRRVTDRGMAENAAAVAAGTLDVAQLFEPLASALEREGKGHVWHACASRGPTSYTTFYSSTRRMAEMGAEFRAMIRGLARTLRWFAGAAPGEVVATIAPFFTDGDRGLMEAAVARYKALGIWTDHPHVPREAFDRLERHMFTGGAIRRKPGFEACVDNAIVDAALAEA